MKIKKIVTASFAAVFGLAIFASSAWAHVTVKPGEVGVAERVNFVMGVPTEKDVPTVTVRLLLPEGLESVRPNVAPGWNIEIKKSDDGESVTEIIWSGGRIPAGQKAEFIFGAKAPAAEGSLVWKAYQTYEGGEVVAWDASPEAIEEYEENNTPKEGEHDNNAPKPYSQTKVIDDLKSTGLTEQILEDRSTPLVLSVLALVLAAFAVTRKPRKA